MDNGRSPGVEKMEAFQDLSAPAPQYFGLHYLETFQIAAVRKKKICYSCFQSIIHACMEKQLSHCVIFSIHSRF